MENKLNTQIWNLVIEEFFTPRNIIIYLLLINVVNFTLMWYDKQEAKKHEWRIKEKTFFVIAALGGSIGGIIGMRVFHHKTKKWYFNFGFIGILIIQIILIYIILQRNV